MITGPAHRVAGYGDRVGGDVVVVVVLRGLDALVGAASDRDSADGHIPGTGVDAVAAAGSDAATADRDRRAGRIDPVAAAVGDRGVGQSQAICCVARGCAGTASDADRRVRVVDACSAEGCVPEVGPTGVELEAVPLPGRPTAGRRHEGRAGLDTDGVVLDAGEDRSARAGVKAASVHDDAAVVALDDAAGGNGEGDRSAHRQVAVKQFAKGMRGGAVDRRQPGEAGRDGGALEEDCVQAVAGAGVSRDLPRDIEAGGVVEPDSGVPGRPGAVASENVVLHRGIDGVIQLDSGGRRAAHRVARDGHGVGRRRSRFVRVDSARAGPRDGHVGDREAGPADGDGIAAWFGDRATGYRERGARVVDAVDQDVDDGCGDESDRSAGVPGHPVVGIVDHGVGEIDHTPRARFQAVPATGVGIAVTGREGDGVDSAGIRGLEQSGGGVGIDVLPAQIGDHDRTSAGVDCQRRLDRQPRRAGAGHQVVGEVPSRRRGDGARGGHRGGVGELVGAAGRRGAAGGDDGDVHGSTASERRAGGGNRGVGTARQRAARGAAEVDGRNVAGPDPTEESAARHGDHRPAGVRSSHRRDRAHDRGRDVRVAIVGVERRRTAVGADHQVDRHRSRTGGADHRDRGVGAANRGQGCRRCAEMHRGDVAVTGAAQESRARDGHRGTTRCRPSSRRDRADAGRRHVGEMIGAAGR